MTLNPQRWGNIVTLDTENIPTLYKIYKYDRIHLTKVNGNENGPLKVRALG